MYLFTRHVLTICLCNFIGGPPNKKVCLQASHEVNENLPQKGRNETHYVNNVSSDRLRAQEVNYPLNTQIELHQKFQENSLSGNCQKSKGYEAKEGDGSLQKGLSPKIDSSENRSVKDLKRRQNNGGLDQPGPSGTKRQRRKNKRKDSTVDKSPGNITKYNLRSTRSRKIKLIECDGSESDELFEITMGQIISGQQNTDSRKANSSSSESDNIKEQESSKSQPLKPGGNKSQKQRGQNIGWTGAPTDLPSTSIGASRNENLEFPQCQEGTSVDGNQTSDQKSSLLNEKQGSSVDENNTSILSGRISGNLSGLNTCNYDPDPGHVTSSILDEGHYGDPVTNRRVDEVVQGTRTKLDGVDPVLSLHNHAGDSLVKQSSHNEDNVIHVIDRSIHYKQSGGAENGESEYPAGDSAHGDLDAGAEQIQQCDGQEHSDSTPESHDVHSLSPITSAPTSAIDDEHDCPLTPIPECDSEGTTPVATPTGTPLVTPSASPKARSTHAQNNDSAKQTLVCKEDTHFSHILPSEPTFFTENIHSELSSTFYASSSSIPEALYFDGNSATTVNSDIVTINQESPRSGQDELRANTHQNEEAFSSIASNDEEVRHGEVHSLEDHKDQGNCLESQESGKGDITCIRKTSDSSNSSHVSECQEALHFNSFEKNSQNGISDLINVTKNGEGEPLNRGNHDKTSGNGQQELHPSTGNSTFYVSLPENSFIFTNEGLFDEEITFKTSKNIKSKADHLEMTSKAGDEPKDTDYVTNKDTKTMSNKGIDDVLTNPAHLSDSCKISITHNLGPETGRVTNMMHDVHAQQLHASQLPDEGAIQSQMDKPEPTMERNATSIGEQQLAGQSTDQLIASNTHTTIDGCVPVSVHNTQTTTQPSFDNISEGQGSINTQTSGQAVVKHSNIALDTHLCEDNHFILQHEIEQTGSESLQSDQKQEFSKILSGNEQEEHQFNDEIQHGYEGDLASGSDSESEEDSDSMPGKDGEGSSPKRGKKRGMSFRNIGKSIRNIFKGGSSSKEGNSKVYPSIGQRLSENIHTLPPGGTGNGATIEATLVSQSLPSSPVIGKADIGNGINTPLVAIRNEDVAKSRGANEKKNVQKGANIISEEYVMIHDEDVKECMEDGEHEVEIHETKDETKEKDESVMDMDSQERTLTPEKDKIIESEKTKDDNYAKRNNENRMDKGESSDSDAGVKPKKPAPKGWSRLQAGLKKGGTKDSPQDGTKSSDLSRTTSTDSISSQTSDDSLGRFKKIFFLRS